MLSLVWLPGMVIKEEYLYIWALADVQTFSVGSRRLGDQAPNWSWLCVCSLFPMPPTPSSSAVTLGGGGSNHPLPPVQAGQTQIKLAPLLSPTPILKTAPGPALLLVYTDRR